MLGAEGPGKIWLFIRGDPVTKRAMKLTWKDAEEIAWALQDKHPAQDPLRLSFPRLHRLVCELAEFADDPQASNERLLETIQMAWHENTK
jgi:FeS assembly protein IscX